MNGAPDRENVQAALQLGLNFLIAQQQAGGCWQGEVKWNTMLASQYVIVSHLCGRSISAERRTQLLTHFRARILPGGAWGMHPESAPYIFFTALAYIALRLLDLSPSDPLLQRAREWMTDNGGVLAIPAWGKFWLAVLNLYGWDGVDPILPELWLLPASFPAHPSRLYNHTRLIALAMAYLYGRRFTAAPSPLTAALRSELYQVPYAQIDFSRYRNVVAGSDLFRPKTRLLQAALWFFRGYEALKLTSLRQRALDECYARITFEMEASDAVALSPVNGLLNLLALWDRRSPHFDNAYAATEYWSWNDDEGYRLCGARSHTWDTAFTVRMAVEAKQIVPSPDLAAALIRASRFLRESQIIDDFSEEARTRFQRDSIRGGWCFSDERHRWPVSDCTAEALIAALELEPTAPVEQRVSHDHLERAVQFILSRQNSDGGFGSFEQRRGALWLEQLNASEMFGDCMVEGSYMECTASCVNGLAHFRRRFPAVLREEIGEAVERGIAAIVRNQRADGTWDAAWGVHFTYSIFFCVEALVAAGLPLDHPAITRAAKWLLAHQKTDGGWGEHWSSCPAGRYQEHPNSQVIMSAWATLTLLAIRDPATQPVIERSIRWLFSRQQANGDFPEESPGGVFFRTGLLHYALYKNYFPLWALARYLARGTDKTVSVIDAGPAQCAGLGREELSTVVWND